jgi:hypothetical protein
MLKLMDVVKRSVAATTPQTDAEWWSSPAGREYLEHNRRAHDRDVDIVRIILWKEANQELAQMVADQLNARVKLLFVHKDGPDAQKAVGLKANLAIYDGEIYHGVTYDADINPTAYEYCDIAERVAEKRAQFDALKHCAKTEFPSGLESLLPRSARRLHMRRLGIWRRIRRRARRSR